jgi:hypothetical protein
MVEGVDDSGAPVPYAPTASSVALPILGLLGITAARAAGACVLRVVVRACVRACERVLSWQGHAAGLAAAAQHPSFTQPPLPPPHPPAPPCVLLPRRPAAAERPAHALPAVCAALHAAAHAAAPQHARRRARAHGWPGAPRPHIPGAAFVGGWGGCRVAGGWRVCHGLALLPGRAPRSLCTRGHAFTASAGKTHTHA